MTLKGANNCATVERLNQYLCHRVPELNEQHGKPFQMPFTAVEPISKNYLILLPQQATLKDVLKLKTEAQAAELEGELDLAERLWIRVLAASPADRQAIDAFKRIALKQARQVTSPAPGSVETAAIRSVAAPTSPPTQTPPSPKQAAPTFEFEVVTVNNQGQISQQEQRRAAYRCDDLGNGVSLDLVLIPGGKFTMGAPAGEKGRSDYEGPQHDVSVSQFWMGKYPITQAQYQELKGENPSGFSENGADCPVERVTWDDAAAFCQKISKKTGREYRLPSEAEWEYACRAGTTTPFYFGPTITTDLVNYHGKYTYGSAPEGQYRKQTTEVGNFSPNAFGLYDMHGNVYEWCLDRWHDGYSELFENAPTDGSAWTTGGASSSRVLRGGSWGDLPRGCRSANRIRGTRDDRNFSIGFRVVCASS
ncbi:MAG: formylglycine-generating enzyme family protein [Cyanobacteria bacterium P01_D01_bin.71]